MKRARRAVLPAGLTLTTLCGCMGPAEEHKEARNLEIRDIDFSGLEAGVYHGAYNGGMKAWRKNQVDVISGATLTSKAHLKAMELALLQAVPATEPAAAGSDHQRGD
ncbi:MAG: FMN-binding protein [Spirochaetes bacterium]|jgi:hypothetical protein|nr:FMN-binding protein [Spirochaetota bacterium]